jgi:hypothetical protein
MYNIIAFSFRKLIFFLFRGHVNKIRMAWALHEQEMFNAWSTTVLLFSFVNSIFSFWGTCESNTHDLSTPWTRNVQCIINLRRCTWVHRHAAKKEGQNPTSELQHHGAGRKGWYSMWGEKKKHGWGGFTPDAAYDRLLYVQSMSQIRHRIRPNTTLSGTLAHSCTDSK